MTPEPLMQFKSHIEGKNADVRIFPDRIEWAKSSLLPGRRDTNMVMIKQIVAVTTHKGGLTYTTLRVTAGAAQLEFRVSKTQAAQVKDTITRLILNANA